MSAPPGLPVQYPQGFSQQQVLTIEATVRDTDGIKKYLALVCGVLQICTGLMAFSLGVVESSTPMLSFGITAHVGLLTTVLAGAFGIQYGRTGGKCPAITSMVFSILSTINYVAAFVIYCAWLAVLAGNEYKIYYGDSNIHIWYSASACAGMMVFVSIINFIASIVQSACACGMVCSCCKPTNTNAYLGNQDFQQQA